MRKPESACVFPAFYNGREWLFLLFHRKSRPDRKTICFWQGVTGGVEDEESIHETAERELTEETNIRKADIVFINHTYSFPIKNEWLDIFPAGSKEVREYVFVAVLKNKEKPEISNEHDAWKWCGYEEARESLYYPENRKALKKCHCYLNNKHNNKKY